MIQIYSSTTLNSWQIVAIIFFSGILLFAHIQHLKSKKGAPTGTPLTNH